MERQDFLNIPVYEKVHDRFYVFTLNEQLLLLLIQSRYEEFLKLTIKELDIQLFSGTSEHFSDFERDRGYISDDAFISKIKPLLQKQVYHNRARILTEVKTSALSDEDKDYIYFFLERLTYLFIDDIDNEHQIKLHNMALDFMNKYPKSNFYKMVESRNGKFREPTWLAADINFGFGFGRNVGELNNFVDRRWGLDLDVKLYLHSTFLGLRGDANFNLVQQDLFFEDIFLPGGQDAFYLSYYDIYLGRRFDLFRRFTFLPFVGYGFTEFYYMTFTGPETYDVQKKYVSDWHYGFDLNINFKKQRFQKTHSARYERVLSQHVGYFRISFVVHKTGLYKVLPDLSGSTYGIYFGFGAHFRKNKSHKLVGSM